MRGEIEDRASRRWGMKLAKLRRNERGSHSYFGQPSYFEAGSSLRGQEDPQPDWPTDFIPPRERKR